MRLILSTCACSAAASAAGARCCCRAIMFALQGPCDNITGCQYTTTQRQLGAVAQQRHGSQHFSAPATLRAPNTRTVARAERLAHVTATVTALRQPSTRHANSSCGVHELYHARARLSMLRRVPSRLGERVFEREWSSRPWRRLLSFVHRLNTTKGNTWVIQCYRAPLDTHWRPVAHVGSRDRCRTKPRKKY
jgi:hypothetical protein